MLPADLIRNKSEYFLNINGISGLFTNHKYGCFLECSDICQLLLTCCFFIMSGISFCELFAY
jgi:hypothetical protein